MSLLFPTHNREEVRFWCVAGPALVAPLVAWLLSFWRIYLTTDAATKVLPAAIVVGLLLGWYMCKRIAWRVKVGLDPRYSRTEPIPLSNRVLVFVLMIAWAWGWAMLMVAAVVIPATAIEARTFKVSKVEHCTRKCLGCPIQAKLADWVDSSEAWLCATSIDPPPVVGEALRVQGRFHALAQHVGSIERLKD